MARRRFFVPQVRRGSAELTGPEAEHLVRVLRAEVGQVYEISDDHDLYLAEIEVAQKSLVSFRILEKLNSPAPSVSVLLLPALFKFDRFEWLVEKAVELGVQGIYPFEATRTERGLAQASNKRVSRWKKIAVEASQQSRRAHLPDIESARSFEETVKTEATVRLLSDEDDAAPPILSVLPGVRTPSDSVAVMIGPEGGWTETAREQCLASGWVSCSLGTSILRSETAAIAALAVVRAAWI